MFIIFALHFLSFPGLPGTWAARRLSTQPRCSPRIPLEAGVDTGSLALKQLPAAVPDNENPADGVVFFKLLITYDTATRQLSESVFLGASPDDKNGLLRLESKNDDTTADKRIKNIVGAALVFAPVINEAASALEPDSAGDWVKLAVALGAPIAIGSLELDGAFIFQTQSATLYGGELRWRGSTRSRSRIKNHSDNNDSVMWWYPSRSVGVGPVAARSARLS